MAAGSRLLYLSQPKLGPVTDVPPYLRFFLW